MNSNGDTETGAKPSSKKSRTDSSPIAESAPSWASLDTGDVHASDSMEVDKSPRYVIVNSDDSQHQSPPFSSRKKKVNKDKDKDKDRRQLRQELQSLEERLVPLFASERELNRRIEALEEDKKQRAKVYEADFAKRRAEVGVFHCSAWWCSLGVLMRLVGDQDCYIGARFRGI